MTTERLLVEPLDWADVRQFVARRSWFIADAMGISEDVIRKIRDDDIADLSGSLLRELSVWIDGYKHGKS